jgi:serine/threonine-protein kinase
MGAFPLSSADWAELRDVLSQAIDCPVDRRAEFLDEACGPSSALRLEVESLLDAWTRSAGFLEPIGPAQAAALIDAGGDELIGSEVGPYRIVRPIGRGGMGIVYLADDTRLERHVALKLLPAWLAASPDARRQLVSEAKAAAALDHPNIAIVHDIGQTDDGRPFIAMAYYEGETLAQRIRREQVPVPEAVRLIAQATRGLGAAHARGCVHCDIKPSNLLVIKPGPQHPEGSVVKILDFGIARHAGDAEGTGWPNAGTAAYAAPERMRGEPPDARADIWSMGVVLYELLTGQLPFRPGTGKSLADAIRLDEPEPAEILRPDVPSALEMIIRRCLRKDLGARYPDTAALIADLDALTPPAPAVVRPPQPAGNGGVARRGTADQAAYEHYVRGRYYADRFDEPSVELARNEFQQAIDRDPAFADAWAGLADTYRVYDYLSLLAPADAGAKARAAAERALAINPDLAAAHTSLATVLCDCYWEWDAADQHFRRAIELDPGYATGHQLYAEFLRDLGRLDDALKHIAMARALDPLSPFYQVVEGLILLMLRRPDEAIRLYKQLLEGYPGYRSAHLYLGIAYMHSGLIEQALVSLDNYDPRRETPDALGMRGCIYALVGRAEEAQEVLEHLDTLARTRYVAAFHPALVYVGLGDFERAIDLLERMVAERSWFVRLLKLASPFDPIRSHPRFQRILETVGLNR